MPTYPSIRGGSGQARKNAQFRNSGHEKRAALPRPFQLGRLRSGAVTSRSAGADVEEALIVVVQDLVKRVRGRDADQGEQQR